MSAAEQPDAPAAGAANVLYDTSRLETLRGELRQLNELALRDGLVALRGGRLITPNAATPPKTKRRAAKAPADKGRREARRLLDLMTADDMDESPRVIGTSCTEAGVVRLLAELRRTHARSNPFLRRLQRYLTRPVAFGLRTVAGISVERIQTVVRHLTEIEQHGWNHYVARRAERRGRQALFTPPAIESAIEPEKRHG